MKLINLSLIIIVLNIWICSAQNESNDDPTKWNYFKIHVHESDDPLFTNLNEDLGLGLNNKDEFEIEYNTGRYGDYILGGVYDIVVNISDDMPQNKYLVVGDCGKNVEKDYRALRYSWSQLSTKTQKGLLNWNKPNKFKIDKLVVNDEDTKNPKTWKYFKILARSDDDKIFDKLQDDMGIDPKLLAYTIVINVSDKNIQNQYIVLGDETDPNSLRFSWQQLSNDVQNGLINWNGTNKENLSENENYQCKVDLYSELIKLYPKYSKSYYIYFLRGKANNRIENYENAVSDFNKVEKLNPNFTKFYLNRAFAYKNLKKYTKAIEDYNAALENESDNLKIYEYRAETYYNLGKYNEAIEDYKYLIKADPDSYSNEMYKWYINEAEKKLKMK